MMSSYTQKTNYLAYSYIQETQAEVKKICEPLFSCLGIQNFGYMRVFDNGRYLLHFTHPKYTKYYLENIESPGPILGSISAEAFSTGESVFTWPSHLKLEEVNKDPILSALNDFDICNGISIYKRRNDSVEIWRFATTKEDQYASSHFINNKALLDHFIYYFNVKAATLINCENSQKLASYNPNKFISGFKTTDSLVNRQEFLSLTSLSKFPIEDKENQKVLLSKREIESLYYLSQGKIIKEVSSILNISPRTTESYVIALKRKLKCNTLSELISCFNKTPFKPLIGIKSE